MMKHALNKDIKKSITHSWGRFLSILFLMALGSFALVGLSVTGDDMRKTGRHYFEKYNTADITVISDYGIDKIEKKAIDDDNGILNTEYIYLKDVTLKNDNKSFRLFSKSDNISTYEVISGRLPHNNKEIALDISNINNYKIGQMISFDEKENSFGTKTLKNSKFKITGFIKSTEILSTLNRGETTIGTGSLDYYAVVDKSAFDSDVYMMAKITFKDTLNVDPYSDCYNDKIIKHKKELEKLLDDTKTIRLNAIKNEYNSKIDIANEKLVNARKKLEDAKNSLVDAKAKIDNAKNEVNSNQKKLNDANSSLKKATDTIFLSKKELMTKKQEIANSKTKLDDALKKIQDSEEKLTVAKGQLDASSELILNKEKELNDNKDALNKADDELNVKKRELESNKDKIDDVKITYDTKIKDLENNISKLEKLLENSNLTDDERNNYTTSLNDLKLQLDKAKEEYNNFIKNTYNPNILEINKGLKEIEEQEKNIDAKKSLLSTKVSELNMAKEEFANKNNTYKNSYEQLRKSKDEYNKNILNYNIALEKLKNAEAEIMIAEDNLNSKKNEYDVGCKNLNEAKLEIEKKETEYYKKLNEYNNKMPSATKEINDGEKKLNAVQDNYNKLDVPVYNVYNRREIPGGEGYKIYETVANIIDSLADIFPWFMYFVAALVTLTTMTRFVDEERINIGTLTSLGYSDKDIIKKFVIYGFLSASIGTLIGVVLGHIMIPYIVYNAYGHGFTIPKIEIHFYLKETIIACVLSLLCSVLPAYIVAKNTLREKPADLLLPKAPASGEKILLERIKPIWKKLNFTKKVTARNIFRYKKRMLMTIFGVAGASAILFTGFSVQKSVSTINDKQFKNIIKYDMIVALNDNLTNNDLDKFKKMLSSKQITGNSSIYYEAVTKETGRNNDKQEIKLIVPEKMNNFNKYIDLHTRVGQKEITLKKNGVVISERLAKAMHIGIGDSFTFEDSKGSSHTVKVQDICEMYAGHFIFMSKDAYEKTYDIKYSSNAYMLSIKNSSLKNTKNVSAKFMSLASTKGVVQNTTMYNLVNTIVKSLNKIMVVLIVLASLLTVVILFNLTNINVAERIRELSTIKVLGFRDNEVTMYIYRETIILSQIGIIIGWLFGILLHAYILNVVPPDEVMFDPSLWIGAYVISFVVINIVTFALKFYINKKLINVDMIEALKSVD